jgi:hypothetical protein
MLPCKRSAIDEQSYIVMMNSNALAYYYLVGSYFAMLPCISVPLLIFNLLALQAVHMKFQKTLLDTKIIWNTFVLMF